MKKLLAADLNFAPSGGYTGPGAGLFANPGVDSANKFELLFSRVVGVMTVIAGLWFIFTFLIGAIGWITSGGDKGAVETARKRITSGLTGLVIVVISIFLIKLVGQFLGFDILNLSDFIVEFSNN